MIRRPPRSTLDRSSAASDVYKRQLQGQRSSLQGEISALEGAASTMQGRVSSASGEESRLSGEISAIRAHVSALQMKIYAEQSAISRLRVRPYRNPFQPIYSAGGVNETLIDQVDRNRLDTQIADHEFAIARIEREIREYGAERRIAAVPCGSASVQVCQSLFG